MKIWKDKEGNKLTIKEFFARWKQGIEGLTPQQKVKAQIQGNNITMLGILLGIVASIINYKFTWWVGIILIGALINSIVQHISLKQQLKLFKNIELMINTQDNSTEDKKEVIKDV